jgi:TolB-like protein/DNA-binding winged helix-turn-helix (wHTH) protein/Tfp pilus assembly protein PilF
MDETVLSFGRWRLLPGSRRLLAGDVPIPLGSRAFDLLLALVEAGGALVTKDDLLRRLWPGTVVEENNLQVQVSALRKALGEDAPRLIATIPGRGYRFTGMVQAPGPPAPAVAPAVAPAAALPPSGGPESVPPPPASRPMLAVLPFANMTGDPEQEYFADGMTEDLTTALSHLRWFAVIARNSAFTYKGRAVDVRQVGRELGVGYVLEGSVRKAGGRVRISAQLCEVETGRHVWAERFDGDLADIFDLQDRVTEAVVGAIEPSLRLAEVERARSRPTESLTAYDLYLRALPQRFLTREGNDEALRLLRRAIALDPGFVAAKGALAGLHTIRFAQAWAEESDLAEAVRLAREVAEGGGEDDPSALAWAAHALAYLARDYGTGLAAADRALALAPNSAPVLLINGWVRTYVSDPETAIDCLARAMRLSPVDPAKFYFFTALSLAHLVAGRHAEAADWARRALRDRPTYLAANRLLATNLARLGRREEAAEALRALLAVAPGYTVAKAAVHLALRDAPAREVFLGGLRMAGLPEG